jgi:hypothetical protein
VMNIWGCCINGIQILYQAFFVTTPTGIVTGESLGVGRKILYEPPFISAFYNYPQRSISPVWSIVWAEVGFDIGALIALGVIAGIDLSSLSINYGMIIGIIGVSISGICINMYYQKEKLFKNQNFPPFSGEETMQ